MVTRCICSALSAVTLAAGCASSALAQSTTPAEEQFRQGLYERETGQPYSAIETLQALLAAHPSLNRARLELAVAYYRTLEFNKARAQAQAVLDDGSTPEPVRLSVLSFLKQLELEQARTFGKPHRFEPSFSLSALYDSNVNAGPDSALLSGGLLQLDPGSTAKSDSGYAVQAGLNHSWTAPAPLRLGQSTGRWGWSNQVGAYYKGYSRLSEYNLGVLTAATGPTLVVGQGWRGNLNLQADQLTLGGSNLALYSSISPSSTWHFASGHELTVDGQWVYRDFNRDIDRGRDAHYRAIGLSYGGVYNDSRLSVQGGVRLFTESARESRFSNDGYEYFVGARQRVWDGGDLFARASWRRSKYEGDEVFFGVPRRETEQRLELGASHQYQSGWLEKWQASATYTRIQNQANLELYHYDRDLVQLTLGRSY